MTRHAKKSHEESSPAREALRAAHRSRVVIVARQAELERASDNARAQLETVNRRLEELRDSALNRSKARADEMRRAALENRTPKAIASTPDELAAHAENTRLEGEKTGWSAALESLRAEADQLTETLRRLDADIEHCGETILAEHAAKIADELRDAEQLAAQLRMSLLAASALRNGGKLALRLPASANDLLRAAPLGAHVRDSGYPTAAALASWRDALHKLRNDPEAAVDIGLPDVKPRPAATGYFPTPIIEHPAAPDIDEHPDEQAAADADEQQAA